MANRNAAANRVTASNLVSASLSSVEAGLLLPLAAQTAVQGKAKIDEGKAKGAAALAVMIAGFASDEIAARPWTFDITVKGDVHHHVETVGYADKGNDDAAWARNGEGAVSKAALGAYKTAFQSEFFNLPENVPAIWTMTGKAIDAARAIRAEGMTAAIEGGKLVLTGGTGERADAMRGATSLNALAKAVGGETGTNRETHGNAKGAGEGEGAGDERRVATPEEILSAALRIVEGVKRGEVALTSAALSYARRIAVLVAADNGADFDD
jgi:hypothetical protein